MAIKSVSAWPDSRPDCQRMMDWAQKKLEAIGVTVEQVDVGTQTLPDGRKLKLPNVIMGVLGNVSNEILIQFELPNNRPQKQSYDLEVLCFLSYRSNNSNNSLDICFLIYCNDLKVIIVKTLRNQSKLHCNL